MHAYPKALIINKYRYTCIPNPHDRKFNSTCLPVECYLTITKIIQSFKIELYLQRCSCTSPCIPRTCSHRHTYIRVHIYIRSPGRNPSTHRCQLKKKAEQSKNDNFVCLHGRFTLVCLHHVHFSTNVIDEHNLLSIQLHGSDIFI